jgi:hypothetical protein
MGVEISIQTVLWVVGSALGQKFRDFSSRAIWRAGFQDLDFEGESSFADLDFFLGFSFLSCCARPFAVHSSFWFVEILDLLILLLSVQIFACSVASFPLQWVTLSFFSCFFPISFSFLCSCRGAFDSLAMALLSTPCELWVSSVSRDLVSCAKLSMIHSASSTSFSPLPPPPPPHKCCAAAAFVAPASNFGGRRSWRLQEKLGAGVFRPNLPSMFGECYTEHFACFVFHLASRQLPA